MHFLAVHPPLMLEWLYLWIHVAWQLLCSVIFVIVFCGSLTVYLTLSSPKKTHLVLSSVLCLFQILSKFLPFQPGTVIWFGVQREK